MSEKTIKHQPYLKLISFAKSCLGQIVVNNNVKVNEVWTREKQYFISQRIKQRVQKYSHGKTMVKTALQFKKV